VAAHAAAEGARSTERALARRFFPLVGAVAAVDLLTKAAAAAALAGGAPRAVFGPFALQLVYNVGSAGGVMLGAHTRAVNLVATGLVVGLLVMLVPVLARVDRRSTAALALIAGGGAGNLVSLAGSARGVEDFLAWRHAGRRRGGQRRRRRDGGRPAPARAYAVAARARRSHARPPRTPRRALRALTPHGRGAAPAARARWARAGAPAGRRPRRRGRRRRAGRDAAPRPAP
jgi:lipoprotein signal peptidase